MNFHGTGRAYGDTNIPKLGGFLNILDQVEIHTIPKPWNEWSLILRESMRKYRDSPDSALPHRFRVNENPCNSQYLRLGMYKLP